MLKQVAKRYDSKSIRDALANINDALDNIREGVANINEGVENINEGVDNIKGYGVKRVSSFVIV